MKTKGLLILLGGSLFASAGQTHHNFNAYFDVRGRVSLEGVITQVRMANPHSRITLEVEGDQGEPEIWQIETGNPRGMANLGWTPSTIPVGSRVTALGFPSLSGRPIMALNAFTFEDGREVRGNMDRYLRASEVD